MPHSNHSDALSVIGNHARSNSLSPDCSAHSFSASVPCLEPRAIRFHGSRCGRHLLCLSDRDLCSRSNALPVHSARSREDSTTRLQELRHINNKSSRKSLQHRSTRGTPRVRFEYAGGKQLRAGSFFSSMENE